MNSINKYDEAEIVLEVNKAVSLEVVEVELALGAQDIVAVGFEGALRNAALLVGGRLIFNDRAAEDARYQRIAAISVPEGSPDQDQIVYVLLHRHGMSMSVTLGRENSVPSANAPIEPA